MIVIPSDSRGISQFLLRFRLILSVMELRDPSIRYAALGMTGRSILHKTLQHVIPTKRSQERVEGSNGISLKASLHYRDRHEMTKLSGDDRNKHV